MQKGQLVQAPRKPSWRILHELYQLGSTTEGGSSSTSPHRARQPTGLCRPSGPTGGSGERSSPVVGIIQTTSMHWNCKHISPVCVGARGRRSALACARCISSTLKSLWEYLPRAGLHRLVSAVSSTSATRSASQPPTQLCSGTHAQMSTLLTAPAERTAMMVKRNVTNHRAVLRRDQRTLLGRLRDRIVSPKTQLRYERAVTRFF